MKDYVLVSPLLIWVVLFIGMLVKQEEKWPKWVTKKWVAKVGFVSNLYGLFLAIYLIYNI